VLTGLAEVVGPYPNRPEQPIMATAPQAAQPGSVSTTRCCRLSNIDWKTYSRLLHAFSEQPGYRLTYDRGELEIMSPSVEHDDRGRILGMMVQVLTDELGLPLKCGGSTTLRRRLRQRGVEPDECFWIANAHRLAGVQRLNLRLHPPPDLAIEVDVSRSSLNRLAIYAALRVPEVWRVEDAAMYFYALTPGPGCLAAPASRSFPQATPADVFGFLQQARQSGDENVILRRLRAWIQQRQAAAQNPPATP
jgi:Uma2 family endonuclease